MRIINQFVCIFGLIALAFCGRYAERGEPNGTQITVYAVTGQVAAIKQISNSSIDISDLPDGFYTILSKNKVVKIVKAN